MLTKCIAYHNSVDLSGGGGGGGMLTKCIACQNRVDLPRGCAYKVTQCLQSDPMLTKCIAYHNSVDLSGGGGGGVCLQSALPAKTG